MADDDLLSLDFTSLVAPSPAPSPVPAAPSPAPTPAPAARPALALEPLPTEPAVPATPAPAAEPPPAVPPVAEKATAAAAPPAALTEAASLLAGGHELEACRRLEVAIKGESLGELAGEVWLALFELLQLLGRQSAFETLALAYARRFESSPPAWAPVESHETADARVQGIVLKGSLDAAVGESLKQLMKLAQGHAEVSVDVGGVSAVDVAGATLLMRAVAALKKAHKAYFFRGAKQLAGVLGGAVSVGTREHEPLWLLLLELHQQAGDLAAFEDAAVNYAVTFEVSPPSFEPRTQPSAPGAAVISATPPLAGRLMGVDASHFAPLAAEVSAGQPLDASRLQSVDAGSAAALKEALAAMAAAGSRPHLTGLGRLVGTYLRQCGIDAVADLELRRT